MLKVDLNKVRETVLSNRASGESTPPAAARKVFVTPDGHIVLGDSPPQGQERPLSEVHQGTFAGR